MSAFTGVLREIADICDDNVAAMIQEEYGGREMVVPADPVRTPEAALCRLIGEQATMRIEALLGSGRYVIPIGGGSRWRQMLRDRARGIHQRLRNGESWDNIARAEGCHIRTVANHAAAHAGRGSKHPDLFEDADA